MTSLEYDFIHVQYLSFNNGNKFFLHCVTFLHKMLVEKIRYALRPPYLMGDNNYSPFSCISFLSLFHPVIQVKIPPSHLFFCTFKHFLHSSLSFSSPAFGFLSNYIRMCPFVISLPHIAVAGNSIFFMYPSKGRGNFGVPPYQQ